MLRRILESAENSPWLEVLEVEFNDFEAPGLPRDAADRTAWQACQAAGAVLVIGNRSGGPDSLDRVIHELSDEMSLPVLTIADPQRVSRDAG